MTLKLVVTIAGFLFNDYLFTFCSAANAGRPHPEGPDDAQLGLHQALRGGDERLGGEAHQVIKVPKFLIKSQ